MTVTLTASLVSYAKSFDYTGNEQTWTAPYSGYYKLEVWGAQGKNYYGFTGGYGGYAKGDILLSKADTVYIQVGNQDNYNGGGYGVAHWGDDGGGATDFRLSGGNWDDALSLNSRIMVAGGGGSAGDRGNGSGCNGYGAGNGGSGGGISGGDGRTCYGKAWGQLPGTGGTQTKGGEMQCLNCVSTTLSAQIANHTTSVYGTFGKGGYSSSATEPYRHSGGGGGYYGGAFGAHGSAGGGSSYISGHTGSVAIAKNSTSEPRAVKISGCTTGTSNNSCSIHYSNKYFVNTIMIDGAGYAWTNTKQGLQQMPNPNGGYYASGVGHSGNGAARITYLGTVV